MPMDNKRVVLLDADFLHRQRVVQQPAALEVKDDVLERRRARLRVVKLSQRAAFQFLQTRAEYSKNEHPTKQKQ